MYQKKKRLDRGGQSFNAEAWVFLACDVCRVLLHINTYNKGKLVVRLLWW